MFRRRRFGDLVDHQLGIRAGPRLHPQVALDASLAAPEHLPPHGRLGLFAQSGALGVAVLASAQRRR